MVSEKWEDDAVRRILQSGKEESDQRAKLGLPLDGNFERPNRADDLRGSVNDHDGGGEAAGCIAEFLKMALIGMAAAVVGAVIVGGYTVKLIVTAIFSHRR